MPPSEIKKDAKLSLKGKWKKAIGIILAYLFFTFILGLVEGVFEKNTVLLTLIEIAILIISVPVSFGLIISFIKLKRGEEVNSFEFIKDGFSRFTKSWGISLSILLKILLPTICMILTAFILVFAITFGSANGNYILIFAITTLFIATTIYYISRALLYVITYYISYDNPELSSKECALKSEELMKGNRGNYFLLELSFIGWSILACFTLGIGLLWLVPYIQIAIVCFYEKVANIEVKTTEKVEKIEK